MCTEGDIKTMNFEELSDQIMGPVLDSMPPHEQRKLLLLLRQLVAPRACAWIEWQRKARKLDTETRKS
jgi:hypothetical protein